MKILFADDDPQMQLAVKATLSRAGYDLVIVGNGKDALDQLEKDNFDLIISDQRMPEMTGQELLSELQKQNDPTPFIMITAYGTINQAVEAMQYGASDFITKPFSAEELERIVERVLSPESTQFRMESAKSQSSGRAIVTNDPVLIKVLEVAEAVARSEATVLVQGESGTGKELIARLIHSCSSRNKSPFVAVNCAALPDSLLESELFGHEKGAFTGAQNKKIGKFELAQGGTILLDEISEMDLGLQAKLLRVLQEREVDRVGGKHPISIDVRVVATTNRNLREVVKQGDFRADLYYRLNVIPLTLPPLRDRVGDVKLLVEHFMKEFMGNKAPTVTTEILQELCNYSWPGNVRELRNAVERSAILSQGVEMSADNFLLGTSADAAPQRLADRVEVIVDDSPPLTIKSGMTVQEMEKTLIQETLKSTNDNRTQAAKLLGISIRTLRNKLNEYRKEGISN